MRSLLVQQHLDENIWFLPARIFETRAIGLQFESIWIGTTTLRHVSCCFRLKSVKKGREEDGAGGCSLNPRDHFEKR
jgi:hypothetical protein